MDEFSDELTKKNIPYSVNSKEAPSLKIPRWTYKYNEEIGNVTETLLDPVPFNLTIFKGQRAVILSRNFSKFVLEHPVSITFRNWIKDTYIPEESFLNTLVRISNVTMIFDNDKMSTTISKVTQNMDNSFDTTHGTCLRFVKWIFDPEGRFRRCYGRIVREVCHLALGDYYLLRRQFRKTGKNECFVANKFNSKVDIRPVLYIARNQSPLLNRF